MPAIVRARYVGLMLKQRLCATSGTCGRFYGIRRSKSYCPASGILERSPYRFILDKGHVLVFMAEDFCGIGLEPTV